MLLLSAAAAAHDGSALLPLAGALARGRARGWVSAETTRTHTPARKRTRTFCRELARTLSRPALSHPRADREGASTEALAEAIADREGVPVAQQRLVCGGRALRPGIALAEQRVGPGSSVELLLRLQGGAPKKGKDKKGKDKKGKDKGDTGSKAPLGEVCITPTLLLSPSRLRSSCGCAASASLPGSDTPGSARRALDTAHARYPR